MRSAGESSLVQLEAKQAIGLSPAVLNSVTKQPTQSQSAFRNWDNSNLVFLITHTNTQQAFSLIMFMFRLNFLILAPNTQVFVLSEQFKALGRFEWQPVSEDVSNFSFDLFAAV